MTPFTNDELTFLARHNFTPEEVHDGRREGKQTRESNAKNADKVLILTSTPCRAMRHRIRTRAGHCAQCNPASIAFTRKETLDGYVYIAGSLNGRLIKIGETIDVEQRARQLKADAYGGFSDWQILITARVKNRGRTEREISLRIPGKRVFNSYIKDGYERTAIEMIQCSFGNALGPFAEVVGLLFEQSYLDRWTAYEFSAPNQL
jgi:hypothetical protein